MACRRSGRGGAARRAQRLGENHTAGGRGRPPPRGRRRCLAGGDAPRWSAPGRCPPSPVQDRRLGLPAREPDAGPDRTGERAADGRARGSAATGGGGGGGALVPRPALVRADEPTASLDGASGRLVAEQLRALAAARGAAVVIATHDQRLTPVATRRVHLADGCLVESP